MRRGRRRAQVPVARPALRRRQALLRKGSRAQDHRDDGGVQAQRAPLAPRRQRGLAAARPRLSAAHQRRARRREQAQLPRRLGRGDIRPVRLHEGRAPRDRRPRGGAQHPHRAGAGDTGALEGAPRRVPAAPLRDAGGRQAGGQRGVRRQRRDDPVLRARARRGDGHIPGLRHSHRRRRMQPPRVEGLSALQEEDEEGEDRRRRRAAGVDDDALRTVPRRARQAAYGLGRDRRGRPPVRRDGHELARHRHRDRGGEARARRRDDADGILLLRLSAVHSQRP